MKELKCTRFPLGLQPRPIAGFKGLTSKGGEIKGEVVEGQGK